MTVSAFLEAELLDRLHDGHRPAPHRRRSSGDPPAAAAIRCASAGGRGYRVFRMGGDVLFDCELRHEDDAAADPASRPAVSRIL